MPIFGQVEEEVKILILKSEELLHQIGANMNVCEGKWLLSVFQGGRPVDLLPS